MIIRLQIANLIKFFFCFVFFLFCFGNLLGRSLKPTPVRVEKWETIGYHVLPFVWCRRPVFLSRVREALLMTLDVGVSPTLGMIKRLLPSSSGSRVITPVKGVFLP